MSVAEKYDKWRKKFRVNSNMKEFDDYFQEVNNALGGSGGDILASDVITDDASNVQVKIDELETATSTNASAITDLQSLTPFLAVADTTASVVISTTADTTFMQFLTNNQSQNDTAYFSYATNTLTILQSGLYNFNIGVNAEKTGGGTGNLEVKFLVNDVLGKNSIGLIQIDNDGTVASGFSGSVILSANDTVKLVFQNQGTGTLTATTTATQDAFRLQVFKIGN